MLYDKKTIARIESEFGFGLNPKTVDKIKYNVLSHNKVLAKTIAFGSLIGFSVGLPAIAIVANVGIGGIFATILCGIIGLLGSLIVWMSGGIDHSVEIYAYNSMKASTIDGLILPLIETYKSEDQWVFHTYKAFLGIMEGRQILELNRSKSVEYVTGPWKVCADIQTGRIDYKVGLTDNKGDFMPVHSGCLRGGNYGVEDYLSGLSFHDSFNVPERKTACGLIVQQALETWLEVIQRKSLAKQSEINEMIDTAVSDVITQRRGYSFGFDIGSGLRVLSFEAGRLCDMDRRDIFSSRLKTIKAQSLVLAQKIRDGAEISPGQAGHIDYYLAGTKGLFKSVEAYLGDDGKAHRCEYALAGEKLDEALGASISMLSNITQLTGQLLIEATKEKAIDFIEMAEKNKTKTD